MYTYQGRCHCGAVSFSFEGPEIDQGLRCNCSICARKGSVMSAFTLAPEKVNIESKEGALSTYQFGSNVAKHHFCNHCGIYTFHETLRIPGHYRVNLGCIEGINCLDLSVTVFDGAAL